MPSAEDSRGFAKSGTTSREGSWLTSIGKLAKYSQECRLAKSLQGLGMYDFPRQELGGVVGQGKHRPQRKS